MATNMSAQMTKKAFSSVLSANGSTSALTARLAHSSTLVSRHDDIIYITHVIVFV